MSNQTLSARLNVGVAQVVVPGTSDGLVSKNGVPGNTTGSAIASGYVGQRVIQQTLRSSAVTMSSNGTVYNVLTSALSLSAGVWLVFGSVGSDGTATSSTYFRAEVSTSSAAFNSPPSGYSGSGFDGSAISRNGNGVTNTQDECYALPPFYQNVTTTQTIYLVAASTSSGGTSNVYGKLEAVRIA